MAVTVVSLQPSFTVFHVFSCVPCFLSSACVVQLTFWTSLCYSVLQCVTVYFPLFLVLVLVLVFFDLYYFPEITLSIFGVLYISYIIWTQILNAMFNSISKLLMIRSNKFCDTNETLKSNQQSYHKRLLFTLMISFFFGFFTNFLNKTNLGTLY